MSDLIKKITSRGFDFSLTGRQGVYAATASRAGLTITTSADSEDGALRALLRALPKQTAYDCPCRPHQSCTICSG